ncbi:bifunctional tRNA (5-methylaminomethyl-2-thiouridine)(34)-methyltransferase MnmD/FAD-dependent 5-carboxymethylaminomethyl-2-thiouridine(34) oxidoreductase MnmC [Vibrio sp. S4M6]|uniref:bifunctional tRNA (5-methylaminomethyl-2-thiouridine)(34)-methyltransferase MnmD/FAD-dependent 5-carboxymethylaminomethyl-2-thiouridine(34) oxidoreductase MnmC n=1 Tax=Vibrio sinus TaxID=2946865 RepID=UPI00202A9C5F|nr:bifunctional tRNA (5-methylaminomethyl-2-thiouridine)(34)-methyltransferase MnmD/FAD-dependent 5-carboxymethylaminomethyl-2-thiouridine(34) oxidoreductase MnmC [Vibrio sinus]MCL9781862.1 bifunctional tRNA (5-methylaminomethyl-2-thiouridine)(34)-methyltransferase MnmD/FAD-dependent 5-carboxymethylaminomethyl-2-thiouridine(34) oxidoreductase MnmC [Vibrio sinus]
MTSIHNAKLDWNDSGTPVSDEFDDVYFSNVNGLEETRYVFLQQNRLPERWSQGNLRRFVIGETGFGTGLNFLAAWQAFDAFRNTNPSAQTQELHFISFEKFPLSQEDLKKAHEMWPELSSYAKKLHDCYPLAIPECHRLIFDDGAVTLDLWFGDIKDCMPMVPTLENGVVDAWFLDGFAPSKNPEMWNQALFNNMARLAKPNGTCATFTAAGFVRRGLIDAGFSMKKVKGFGTKREMIAGEINQPSQTRTIRPQFHRAKVDNVKDVAIIGGGIASATLAKALSRRGIHVTLYCSDSEPALGASGNKQGAIYPLLNESHTGVARVFAPGMLFAKQFVNQCAHQLPFDYDWCGVTQLMWDEKSRQKLSKVADCQLPEAFVRKLSAEETNSAVGLPVNMESLHFPQGGWLCPAEFTRNLIHSLTESGCLSVHWNTHIETLNWHSDQQSWSLEADGKHFQHQAVVIANGHQFDTFEQTRFLPLGKVKGQVSHIPSTKTLSQLKSVLCYDGYMTPRNPTSNQHCIGASYDRTHIDQLFDPQAQLDNADKLMACLPDQSWPKEVDISDNESRQGIRCVSRDHLPFVGNVGDFEHIVKYFEADGEASKSGATLPQYTNLFCLLGLGSRGLSSSPLMAEVLASQICGNPLPLPADVLESIHPSKMWIRKLMKGKPIRKSLSH